MNKKDQTKFSSKKVQSLMVGIVTAYVEHMYEMMQKPENRGDNFTWKQFPKLVGHVASNHAFLYFSKWDSFSEGLKESIKQRIHEFAVKLAETKLES